MEGVVENRECSDLSTATKTVSNSSLVILGKLGCATLGFTMSQGITVTEPRVSLLSDV